MAKTAAVHKKSKIPTIFGILLLFLGTVAGVIIIKGKQIFRLGANESTYPTNIRVTNISETSVNISWTTDAETFGFIKYGATPILLDKTSFSLKDTPTTTHYFKLADLKEKEKYYFQINSNGIDYFNEKQPFQFTTTKKTDNPNESVVIYGQVFSQNAQPQDGAIVYATVGGSSPLSTITEDDGTWAILISSARTKDLGSYVALDKNNTLVELEVLINNNNVSSVTTYSQLAKPLPPVIIGKSYDYLQNSPNETENNVPKSETSPLMSL